MCRELRVVVNEPSTAVFNTCRFCNANYSNSLMEQHYITSRKFFIQQVTMSNIGRAVQVH